MVSNISFGSTYKVSTFNNTARAYSDFAKFSLTKEALNEAKGTEKESLSSKHYMDFQREATYTTIVPDYYDNQVEAFCANNGINYTKLTKEQLLAPRRIFFRVEAPQEDKTLVKVNAKKLEKIIENQNSNFNHCEDCYERHFREDVSSIIRNGDQFPTTSLYIQPNGNSVDDTVEYINHYGSEKLNEGQLLIDFSQRTSIPDHCIYFGLKDAGLDSIPVYVNDDTLKLCKALNILD